MICQGLSTEKYCKARNSYIGNPELVCAYCSAKDKKIEHSQTHKNVCIFSQNTGIKINTTTCKACKNSVWIICSNSKVVADRVKSPYCKTCKHRTSEK